MKWTFLLLLSLFISCSSTENISNSPLPPSAPVLVQVPLIVNESKYSFKFHEMTVLIPSVLYNEETLELTINAWVFEKKENSKKRSFFKKVLAKFINEKKLSTEQSRILDDRLSWFLVDNKSNKFLSLKSNGETLILGPTQWNGHIQQTFKLQNPVGPKVDVYFGKSDEEYLGNLSVDVNKDYKFLVVSDIDDTIKVSNVLNQEELFQNTFVNDFEFVRDMNVFYQKIKSNVRDVSFVYLSGSPWHLFSALHKFILDSQFPMGPLLLRDFRVWDTSIINFIQGNTEVHKSEKLKFLSNYYPNTKFILVGDSGEKDPEIYYDFYKNNKTKVHAILIRDIGNITKDSNRFASLINSSDVHFELFEDPNKIRFNF